MGAELLNLPWATVLFLAAGYAGYFVANTGNRDHHKPMDTAFSSAVFGFFALFAFQLLPREGFWILVASLASFSLACLLGAFWRRFGREVLRKIFRVSRISFNDDIQSAWATIGNVTNVSATELTVYLKNGTLLQSSDLSQFGSLPNGPCVLGGNGDVLMYVTDIRDAGGESKGNGALFHDGWGAEITYIPASEIARVELRRILIS